MKNPKEEIKINMTIETRRKKNIVNKATKKICLPCKIDNKNEEIIECPICYDKIGKNNYIVTKCNHIFCNDCLFKSLNKQSCCPICRNDLFNFNKIKDLDDDVILNLESRAINRKNNLIDKFIRDINEAILFSAKNNLCSCINDEVKQILNTYLSCHGFKNLFNRLTSSLLIRYFHILSVESYENLYCWLKNSNDN